MNTKMYGWLLGMTSVLVPLAAPAATDCYGTVTNALLYADGSLNVRGSWRNLFVRGLANLLVVAGANVLRSAEHVRNALETFLLARALH